MICGFRGILNVLAVSDAWWEMKIVRFLMFLGALSWSVAAMAAEVDIANGLNTEIFNDQMLNQLAAKRIDPNIDWHWASARPVESIGSGGFSIRWTGWIKAPAKGQYEFLVSGDDGYRLWIDDRPVIANWVSGWQKESASIEMTGEPQKFKMEYLMSPPSGAWITLRWRQVGNKDALIVPTEAFFPNEEAAKAKVPVKRPNPKSGLVAEYFDKDFKKRFGTGRVHRAEAMLEGERLYPGVPREAGARYSGYLIPPTSGRYRFVAYGDDRVRIVLNGKPLVETTHDKGESAAYMELEEGKAFPLGIEFRNTSGWGRYYLHWIPPNAKEELCIPPECLFPNKQSLPKGAI